MSDGGEKTATVIVTMIATTIVTAVVPEIVTAIVIAPLRIALTVASLHEATIQNEKSLALLKTRLPPQLHQWMKSLWRRLPCKCF